MSINTNKPFTRASAIRAGMTDDQLGGDELRRLFQGVYISRAVGPTLKARAQAALLVSPRGSYVSHHTAALLWGGWSPPDQATHVSSSGESRSRRRGIASHRGLEGLKPTTHQGLLLTPPAQVFVELAAAGVGLVDLVAVGDSLIGAGVVSRGDLERAASLSSSHGCRLARRAVAYVRAGVDSVMETRLRMLMVLAGLPEPVVNKILRAEDGSWIYRIDLCYLALLLAIEYEGRQHAEDPAQWRSDIRRREQLESEGWRFILITAEDVYQQPLATLDRIRSAMEDRGEQVRRGRPSAEWSRCFPGRAS